MNSKLEGDELVESGQATWSPEEPGHTGWYSLDLSPHHPNPVASEGAGSWLWEDLCKQGNRKEYAFACSTVYVEDQKEI